MASLVFWLNIPNRASPQTTSSTLEMPRTFRLRRDPSVADKMEREGPRNMMGMMSSPSSPSPNFGAEIFEVPPDEILEGAEGLFGQNFFEHEGQGEAEVQESPSKLKSPSKQSRRRPRPSTRKSKQKEPATRRVQTPSEKQSRVCGVTWHAPSTKKVRKGHGKRGLHGYWESRILKDAQRY
jgi:hypothetical protein